MNDRDSSSPGSDPQHWASPLTDIAPLSMPIEALADPSPSSPTTGLDYEPGLLAAAAAEPAPPHPAGAKWTVGTLSYTTGKLAILFFLLLGGDLAYSIRERSVGPVVTLMFRQLSESDTLFSVLFAFLPTSLSLVISPIVSYQSDRFRSRWGRRIPFLLIPTPIAAGAMIAIAYVNELGSAVQHVFRLPVSSHQTCALACFAVLWTTFEVAAVVAGAVLGALINDVVPREVMGRFYGFFRQISLGVGIAFNLWVVGHADAHFKAIFIGAGVLFGIGFSFMCLTVREGKYPPPPGTAVAGSSNARGASAPFMEAVSRVWQATKTYFRECFKINYYLRLFAGLTLAAATFTPVNLFALLYAKQLNVSTETYGHVLGYSFIVSLLLASPLGWIVDKFHTLRVSMATTLIYAVLMILFGLSIHDARTFCIALTAHTVLSGCYWTVSSPLGQALFPRLTFAQYSSAGGIVASLFTLLYTPALGRLLDFTHHDYRLTFLLAGILGLAAVGLLLIVHRDFLRLGGPVNYVAPGDGA